MKLSDGLSQTPVAPVAVVALVAPVALVFIQKYGLKSE